MVALGGALVLGALPRVQKYTRVRDAVVMAIGVAILANSRPYEGLLFSLPIAAAVALWIFGKAHPPFSVSFRRFVLPAVLVLAITGAGTAYYYWRVTGNPFRMTYQVNRDTYATAPYFLWQSPRPEPVYRHPLMRDFYRWELAAFRGIPHAGRSRLPHLGQAGGTSWKLYCGPLLTIPLLAFPWILRDRKMRFPIFAGACLCARLGRGNVDSAALRGSRHRPHLPSAAPMHASLAAVVLAWTAGWSCIGAGHPDNSLRHGLVARWSRSGPRSDRAGMAPGQSGPVGNYAPIGSHSRTSSGHRQLWSTS